MFTFSDAWFLTSEVLINDTNPSQLFKCGVRIKHSIFTEEVNRIEFYRT